MRLENWLHQNDVSQRDFAKKIGSHQANVSNWISGKVRPSLKSIEAVRKATKEQVSYADWRSTVLKGGKHAAKV